MQKPIVPAWVTGLMSLPPVAAAIYAHRDRQLHKCVALGATLAALERHEKVVTQLAVRSIYPNGTVWLAGWDLAYERLVSAKPIIPTDIPAWVDELVRILFANYSLSLNSTLNLVNNEPLGPGNMADVRLFIASQNLRQQWKEEAPQAWQSTAPPPPEPSGRFHVAGTCALFSASCSCHLYHGQPVTPYNTPPLHDGCTCYIVKDQLGTAK